MSQTMTHPVPASQVYSRRFVLKGAAAMGIALTASQSRLIRSLAQESEDLQTIINIAATAESLAVTLFGGAIDSAKNGGYDKEIPEPVIGILEAARAAEYFHLAYLLDAGAQPLTQTFVVSDEALLTRYDTLFSTAVKLESAFIAAYIAAARQFTALNQPELVKIALAVAEVEGEHRVLANYALGSRPANDIGFAAATFGTVGEAAQALMDLGFIGGTGMQVSYPGPGEIAKDAVRVHTPFGPSVAC